MQKWIIAARAGLREGAGYVGAFLIAYGAWEIYHPAGYILAGVCLIAGAVLHGWLNP
jgi:hypothetical protein